MTAGGLEVDGKENSHAGPEDEWTDIQLQPSGDLNKVSEQAPAPPKKLMLKKKLGPSTKAKAKAPPGGLAEILATSMAAWACNMIDNRRCILTWDSGKMRWSTFGAAIQMRLLSLSWHKSGPGGFAGHAIMGIFGLMASCSCLIVLYHRRAEGRGRPCSWGAERPQGASPALQDH